MTISAAEIAEEALREIGTLSPYDTASDPEEFAIALRRLQYRLEFLVGTTRLWFFTPTPETQDISLAAGVTEYNLFGNTEDALEFVDDAHLIDESGRQHPVKLVRRSEFDKTYAEPCHGDPYRLYVERKDRPKVFIYPAPQVAGWTLVLTGRKYSTVVTSQNGEVAHGFPAAWQLYMILELAGDLGSGPITTLPTEERREKRDRARTAYNALMSAHNRENVRRARTVAVRNF